MDPIDTVVANNAEVGVYPDNYDSGIYTPEASRLRVRTPKSQKTNVVAPKL